MPCREDSELVSQDHLHLFIIIINSEAGTFNIDGKKCPMKPKGETCRNLNKTLYEYARVLLQNYIFK